MKNYGQTVRELRQDKGFLQKEIYEGVVAKSFAIRFEKGEVMLQYDTFLTVLDNLNITQEEFHYIHRDYQKKVDESLWAEFVASANSGSQRSLKDIYQKYGQSKTVFERVIAYLANVLSVYREYGSDHYQSQLNTKELAYLQNYLLKRKIWTLDDINIFTTCYFIFEHQTKQLLMKNCYSSLRKYKDFENYYERMVTLLSNYIVNCYVVGQYQEANRWYVKLQSLPVKKEALYHSLKIELCSAYYYYTKRDVKEASSYIEKYQGIMKSCGLKIEGDHSVKLFLEFKQAFGKMTKN